MNKNLLIIAVLVIGVIAVVGCQTSQAPEPTPIPVATPTLSKGEAIAVVRSWIADKRHSSGENCLARLENSDMTKQSTWMAWFAPAEQDPHWRVSNGPSAMFMLHEKTLTVSSWRRPLGIIANCT